MRERTANTNVTWTKPKITPRCPPRNEIFRAISVLDQFMAHHYVQSVQLACNLSPRTTLLLSRSLSQAPKLLRIHFTSLAPHTP